MVNQNLFTANDKGLIAVSASVAAGCQPCTEYHIGHAREGGACERSIALAIVTALGVRESATRTMDEWAAACQGARPTPDSEFADRKRLTAELAAVAAAASVNSVPDLKARLETAVRAGATPEQVRAAIAIANAIKRTAEQKIAGVLRKYEGAGESCCAPDRGAEQRCGCR